jgi:DNA topoisomerase IA
MEPARAETKLTIGYVAVSPRTTRFISPRSRGFLANSAAPANKVVVIKTMMRRFQISDPLVAEEGYQDYLTSVERRPIPMPEGLRNIRRLMAMLNPKIASVKVEDLIDSRLIRKLEENGLSTRSTRAMD